MHTIFLQRFVVFEHFAVKYQPLLIQRDFLKSQARERERERRNEKLQSTNFLTPIQSH